MTTNERASQRALFVVANDELWDRAEEVLKEQNWQVTRTRELPNPRELLASGEYSVVCVECEDSTFAREWCVARGDSCPLIGLLIVSESLVISHVPELLDCPLTDFLQGPFIDNRNPNSLSIEPCAHPHVRKCIPIQLKTACLLSCIEIDPFFVNLLFPLRL